MEDKFYRTPAENSAYSEGLKSGELKKGIQALQCIEDERHRLNLLLLDGDEVNEKIYNIICTSLDNIKKNLVFGKEQSNEKYRY